MICIVSHPRYYPRPHVRFFDDAPELVIAHVAEQVTEGRTIEAYRIEGIDEVDGEGTVLRVAKVYPVSETAEDGGPAFSRAARPDEERFWKAMTELITERSRETPGEALNDIADRAERIQARSRERIQSCVSHYDSGADGMSLRDYFAAAALTGLLANPEGVFEGDTIAEQMRQSALGAYAVADAMLAEREREAP